MNTGRYGPMIRLSQALAIVVLGATGVSFALPLDEAATRSWSLAGTVVTCLLMIGALSWAAIVNTGRNKLPWIGTLGVYALGLALFLIDPVEPGPAGDLSAAMLVGPLATAAQVCVVAVLARHVLAYSRIGRVVLDTLWLSSAALLLAWHFAGNPIVDDPLLAPVEKVLLLSQLLFVSVLFGFVATVLSATDRVGRRLFLLLASPAILLAIALAVQARAGSAGELDHGTLADFAFPLAFGVGTVAVFESRRSDLIRPRDVQRGAGQLVITWLPLLAWLVMLGLEEASLIQHTSFLGFIVGVGAVARLAVLFRENAALNRVLYSRSMHDHLTGLPNRTALLELIATFGEGPGVVLLVDLDRFKTINDTIGHRAGDTVLVEAARRMERVVGPSWMVARLSGDEFIIVSGEESDDAALIELGRTVVDELSEPFTVGDREVWVSATIGFAATAHNLTPDELLEAADSALRRGKSSARGEVLMASAMYHQDLMARRELEIALREGIDRGELRCVYQPKVDLVTEEIIGIEALVRWNRPGHGNIEPSAFIDVAEESGLITRIDDWVLRQALDDLSHWNTFALPRRLSLSTNMSAWQLSRADVHDQVAKAIAANGQVDPSQLTIELTETALIETPDIVARRLQRLRNVGVGVSVDDFGAGYTAIAYLRYFGANEVKIDRSLIDELSGGPEDDNSIAAAVISLGRALDLDVVAEGVETQAQAASLRRLGCRQAQGFLFARPMPAEDITRLLIAGPPDEAVASSPTQARLGGS